MKVELTLIQADEQQFNALYPLKDHSEIKNKLDEFDKYPALGTKEFLYVGYFIMDGVFNIIHIPEAKHFGDALAKAMNAIVLPTINNYYQSKPNNVVDNTAKEN